MVLYLLLCLVLFKKSQQTLAQSQQSNFWLWVLSLLIHKSMPWQISMLCWFVV